MKVKRISEFPKKHIHANSTKPEHIPISLYPLDSVPTIIIVTFSITDEFDNLVEFLDSIVIFDLFSHE